MKTINPVRSMEAAQERLIAQCEIEDAKKRRNYAFAAKFARLDQIFEKFEGGVATGEKIKATLKEVKLLEAQEEKKFLKRLGAFKGVGERPRLVTYSLSKKETIGDAKPWWRP